MFGLPLGSVIEILVAILLILTIGYCAMLNERLKRLRQDEGALKGMVGELIGATKVAERAIAALKGTVQEAERSIGDRLDEADRLALELGRLIEEGRRMAQRPLPAQTRAPSVPLQGRAEPIMQPQTGNAQARASVARSAFSTLQRN